MKRELLDEIAVSVDSHYLSDLYTSEYRKKVYTATQKLEPRFYTEQEWEKAVAYILNESAVKFGSTEEAKQHLLKHLKNKMGA